MCPPFQKSEARTRRKTETPARATMTRPKRPVATRQALTKHAEKRRWTCRSANAAILWEPETATTRRSLSWGRVFATTLTSWKWRTRRRWIHVSPRWRAGCHPRAPATNAPVRDRPVTIWCPRPVFTITDGVKVRSGPMTSRLISARHLFRRLPDMFNRRPTVPQTRHVCAPRDVPTRPDRTA